MLLGMNQLSPTRERILEAAGNLMAARSYADVGVAEICSVAGVKKGSFYHFFPSKQELTLAVLEGAFVRFKQYLLDAAFAPDKPPMQRLTLLSKLVYKYQASIQKEAGFVPGCPFGNMAAEQGTQDDALRQKVHDLFRRLAGEIRMALEEAVDHGDIGEIDASATADAMLAYLEGILLLAKTRNDPEVIRSLLPAMADIRIAPQGR